MRERDYYIAAGRNTEVKTFPPLRGLRIDDIQAAAADYLKSEVTGQRAFVAGAEILKRDGATIADIAATLNQARGNVGSHVVGRSGHIAAALSTGDLQNVLSTMYQEVMRDSHEYGIRNLARWTVPVEVENFKKTNYADVEIEGMGETFEAGEPSMATLANSGEDIEVKSFHSILTITRPALFNNDIKLIERGVAKYSRAASKKEKTLAYAVLSSNPTLNDGSPLIGTANTVTGSAGVTVSVQDVAKAFSAMARQKDLAGDDSDATPRFILAPPELATAAHESVIKAYGSDTDIAVISAAGLAAGAWYALADPEEYPVIGRVVLEGSSSLHVEPFTNRKNFDVDGASMKALLDVNYTPLSRIGIVKVNQQ